MSIMGGEVRVHASHPRRGTLDLARLEDVRWMARHGAPFHEAAERLGMRVGSLQRWLDKHDRETRRRLVANSEDRGLTMDGRVK